ncbi:MAG: hypothetical protein LRY26_00265 [Bacilli bacterium]|nr:hypothetical protein [Bacilli bacterium]
MKEEMALDNFYKDKRKSEQTIAQFNSLSRVLSEVSALKEGIKANQEIFSMMKDNIDDEMLNTLIEDLIEQEKLLEKTK